MLMLAGGLLFTNPHTHTQIECIYWKIVGREVSTSSPPTFRGDGVPKLLYISPFLRDIHPLLRNQGNVGVELRGCEICVRKQ